MYSSDLDFTRSYGLDAQFPLSDHADFDDLLRFVDACRPKRVYTVFSHPVDLAKEIERRLRIPAEPLKPKGERRTPRKRST